MEVKIMLINQTYVDIRMWLYENPLKIVKVRSSNKFYIVIDENATLITNYVVNYDALKELTIGALIEYVRTNNDVRYEMYADYETGLSFLQSNFTLLDDVKPTVDNKS